MSRSHGHPDANLHRPFLGPSGDVAINPGAPRGPLPTSVFVAASGQPGRAPGWRVSLDGPGGILQRQSCAVQLSSAVTGRSVHVGHAEDDDDAVQQPSARVHPEDDAVDVPDHVRVLHIEFRSRARPLLDHVQRHRHRDPGLCNGLGASCHCVLFPAINEAGDSRGADAGDKGGRCQ